MIDRTYVHEVENTISGFDPAGANRYFLFGSATRSDRFGDIDLGVLGNKASHKKLSELRERFQDSILPYTVDIVDFDEADADFRDYVLKNEQVVWMN